MSEELNLRQAAERLIYWSNRIAAATTDKEENECCAERDKLFAVFRKVDAERASPTPPTTEGRDYIVKIAQRLKRLAQQADPAPWSVRPQKYDDWGWIRDAEGYCVVQAKAGHDVDLDEHRRTKTDPYKGNADFIAQARNDVEAICDALLSSPRVEEVRRMREALIQARQELWDALHSHMSEAEFNKEVEYIDEALSLPDGEGKEKLARPSGSAPTTTGN